MFREILKGILGFKQETYTDRGRIYSSPTSASVREIYDRHVRQNDRVLEVGSGLGYLVNQLLPQYRGSIQQSDGDTLAVSANKRQNPGSNIVHLDLSLLQVPNDLHTTIIGVNTLDTAIFPEATLFNLRRILSPDGLVLHFRDQQITQPPLAYMDYDRKQYIPFPVVDESRVVGIRLVRKKDLFSKTIEPKLNKFLIQYSENPDPFYEALLGNKTMAMHLAMAGETISPNAQILYFSDFYSKKFKFGLNFAGFDIVESGLATKEMVMDRKGYDSHVNVFVNNRGRRRASYDAAFKSQVGQGKVKVISTIEYLVARKIQVDEGLLREALLKRRSGKPIDLIMTIIEARKISGHNE